MYILVHGRSTHAYESKTYDSYSFRAPYSLIPCEIANQHLIDDHNKSNRSYVLYNQFFLWCDAEDLSRSCWFAPEGETFTRVDDIRDARSRSLASTSVPLAVSLRCYPMETILQLCVRCYHRHAYNRILVLTVEMFFQFFV